MRRFLGAEVVYTVNFLASPLFSVAVKGRHPFRRPLWEFLEIGVPKISFDAEFKNSLIGNS